MRIGIGIPNAIPGVEGALLLDWAKRADALGFTSLTTIGRVAYPNFEELTVLSAAAAVTERIGLVTNMLLGPTRDPVLLAKEAASLDQLSGGRFVLGIAVGARPDDYEASQRSFHDRGRRMDEALELMHRAWRGEAVAGSARSVSPRPYNGERVPILGGGTSDAVIRRAAKWAIGWGAGGGGPEGARAVYEKVRAAWQEAGREAKPELFSLQYFALGPQAETGSSYIQDYYGPFAEYIWPGVPRDAASLAEVARQFEEIGTDELVLVPTIASLEQMELAAEALL